jgi:hypothetical protein
MVSCFAKSAVEYNPVGAIVATGKLELVSDPYLFAAINLLNRSRVLNPWPRLRI